MKGTHAIAAVTAARKSWKGWDVATRIQVACQALSLSGDILLCHRREMERGVVRKGAEERMERLSAALKVLFDEWADQRVAVLELLLVEDKPTPVSQG